MTRFDLDTAQNTEIDASFVAMAPHDELLEKKNFINEKLYQVARQLHALSRKCPEQTIALRKLQEAQHWYTKAVEKYGQK